MDREEICAWTRQWFETHSPASRDDFDLANMLADFSRFVSGWRKITADDLPKVGDEVLYSPDGVMEVDASRAARSYNEWDCNQALYFRPICAPGGTGVRPQVIQ